MIINKAKPNGLLTVAIEGKRSNCFSITQQVGQKRKLVKLAHAS